MRFDKLNDKQRLALALDIAAWVAAYSTKFVMIDLIPSERLQLNDHEKEIYRSTAYKVRGMNLNALMLAEYGNTSVSGKSSEFIKLQNELISTFERVDSALLRIYIPMDNAEMISKFEGIQKKYSNMLAEVSAVGLFKGNSAAIAASAADEVVSGHQHAKGKKTNKISPEEKLNKLCRASKWIRRKAGDVDALKEFKVDETLTAAEFALSNLLQSPISDKELEVYLNDFRKYIKSVIPLLKDQIADPNKDATELKAAVSDSVQNIELMINLIMKEQSITLSFKQ